MDLPLGDRRGAGSAQSLRRANRRRFLGALGSRGPLSQAELSRETGLSPAAVSALVKELVADEVVRVASSTRGGRRVTEVSLVEGEQLVLGVDLGHRHVRIALADSAGTILAEITDPRGVAWRLQSDLSRLSELRDRVVQDADRSTSAVVLAAIGVPVPFEPTRPGRLAREWSVEDVSGRIAQALGVPVVIENDANLGAIGEARRGAGNDCADFIYVKAAHGLGAGLVLGSRLYHGGLNAAGEIGHMSVDDTGPLCACGGRGCLELYAAGGAIATALARVHGSEPSLQDIVARCLAGEPSFVRAVADAGQHLGFVLANVTNLLAPSRIILGGELSSVGNTLVDAVQRGVRTGAARTLGEQVEVVSAELGDRAEVVGAVELALAALREQLEIPVADSLFNISSGQKLAQPSTSA
ncbi:putative NBD/HSP70 family sugar kinase [Marmoricola sp. URHA0025 HA25]